MKLNNKLIWWGSSNKKLTLGCLPPKSRKKPPPPFSGVFGGRGGGSCSLEKPEGGSFFSENFEGFLLFFFDCMEVIGCVVGIG